ncbi:hypothetical protein HZH68_004366 [Vespula germanica]|uniref:Uncharacterized protein n=1 Tax=Vespula germanica TaxID=30212 RepID=A0A834NI91_VESGE|nr:hypothetical protein HZH68_004366 [Vespula germanica]
MILMEVVANETELLSCVDDGSVMVVCERNGEVKGKVRRSGACDKRQSNDSSNDDDDDDDDDDEDDDEDDDDDDGEREEEEEKGCRFYEWHSMEEKYDGPLS